MFDQVVIDAALVAGRDIDATPGPLIRCTITV
jgi:hypothetical protein